jgi:CBS domain-containing protein
MLPPVGPRDDASMLTDVKVTQMRNPFETLTVGDAMHPGVVSCPPDTPLLAVAALMSMHGIHSVFVFDDDDGRGPGDAYLGIVSDLDLVAAAGVLGDTRTAGQSAVTPILTVTTEDALGHAARLMVENSLSHLSVVDPSTGHPVGVISTIDLARVIATPA